MQWIPVPPQCSFASVDLGFSEGVSRTEGDRVKVAAAMALAHLNTALRKDKQALFGSWGQVLPNEFEDGLRSHVPTSQTGEDWLKLFKRRKEVADVSAAVDPAASYRMRAIAEHVCRESGRARRLIGNLNEYSRSLRETFLSEGGRCLSSSHRSLQEKCGIFHPIADEFLKKLQDAGRQQGLFGGRLVLGGAASVIAVLVHQSARQALRDLVESFCAGQESCGPGRVIIGSQDGGVLRGWWEGVLEPGTPEDHVDLPEVPDVAVEPAAVVVEVDDED